MTKDRKVLKTNFVNMLRILGVQVQGLDLSPGLNELKKDDAKFLKSPLLIKHTSGVKYTVDNVNIDDVKNPIVTAYRYDSEGGESVEIEITKKEFKDYEAV